jgi:hypothetical protein
MSLSRWIADRVPIVVEYASAATPALVTGGALLAYIAQPYVPLLPHWALGVGVWTALSLVSLSAGIARENAPVVVAQVILVLIGFLGLSIAIDRAMSIEEANSGRCLAIQLDMLSARPRIVEGPDKFQALGCRPQGTDTKIFVPPTDRERAAGKALPWGGYPPPN